MSASVKHQIEALSSVDPADAARINSAITHCEFSKAKKKELALAVLRQVSKAVDDEDPSIGSGVFQGPVEEQPTMCRAIALSLETC